MFESEQKCVVMCSDIRSVDLLIINLFKTGGKKPRKMYSPIDDRTSYKIYTHF